MAKDFTGDGDDMGCDAAAEDLAGEACSVDKPVKH